MTAICRVLAFLALAAAVRVEAQEGVFSDVNRFALSYQWLDSVSAAVRGETRLMFSSPVARPALDSLSLLDLNAGRAGRLTLDIAGRMAGGGAVGEGLLCGALEGCAAYESRFVRAWVNCRVATMDSLARTWPRESHYERFQSGNAAPIDGAFDFRPTLVEGYFTIGGRAFGVTMGKEKLRWGPGYKGTLGLSGTAPASMLYYHITANLGHAVRVQSFLAGFDDETTYEAELDSAWPREQLPSGKSISTIPARYGAGQRIDAAFGRHVQVGVYELVDFFGSADLTRFANPFQIYYIGDAAGGTNGANLLAGIDCNVRAGPVRVYAELLNDDVTVFEDAGNPDKYAWMAGMQYAGRRALRLVGLEYAHVARYVYGHPHVISRHAVWGEPLGWPYGNYQEHANVHAVFALSERLRMRAEAAVWYGGAGALADDWYLDSMPDLDHAPYLPQRGDLAVTALIEARWQPLRWLALDASLRPGWRAGRPVHQAAALLRISAPRGWRVHVADPEAERTSARTGAGVGPVVAHTGDSSSVLRIETAPGATTEQQALSARSPAKEGR